MLKRLRKQWLACRDGWIDIAEVEHSVRLGGVCVIQPHRDVGVDAPNAPYVEKLQAKQGLSRQHIADSSKGRAQCLTSGMCIVEADGNVGVEDPQTPPM